MITKFDNKQVVEAVYRFKYEDVFMTRSQWIDFLSNQIKNGFLKDYVDQLWSEQQIRSFAVEKFESLLDSEIIVFHCMNSHNEFSDSELYVCDQEDNESIEDLSFCQYFDEMNSEEKCFNYGIDEDGMMDSDYRF